MRSAAPGARPRRWPCWRSWRWSAPTARGALVQWRVFLACRPGFVGQLQSSPAPCPGVQDIETADGTAFVSVASARGPDAADGIYALPLAGGKLRKLAGAPKDFHPRGIGLYRTPDGGPVPDGGEPQRSSGRFSIDSFEVTDPATAPALVAQGTIEGGMLIDPQDVAAAGPAASMSPTAAAGKNLTAACRRYGAAAGAECPVFQRHDCSSGGGRALRRPQPGADAGGTHLLVARADQPLHQSSPASASPAS